ncbi:ATP synthase complex assembly protein atp12 [Coelomomyces lativittatus]|nr:ATP synthase complex assembly protein atp12 [Coelomomyces lativittatus]
MEMKRLKWSATWNLASHSFNKLFLLNMHHGGSRASHSLSHPEISSPSLHQTSYLRRFWKNTSVQSTKDGYHIYLDHRPLKTPQGKLLTLPQKKSLAAWMIAKEWQCQPDYFKFGSFPLTSLFVRAQDDLHEVQHRKDVIEKLIQFLHTDTLCYPQSYPASLVELQKKHWDPLVSWCQTHFQVELQLSTGLMDYGQSQPTLQTLQKCVERFSPLELSCTWVDCKFIK